jgi:putative chitinase
MSPRGRTFFCLRAWGLTVIFNRILLFNELDQAFGRLTAAQRRALDRILDFVRFDSYLAGAQELVAVRRLAYMLATITFETAHTFRPLHGPGSAGYFGTPRGFLAKAVAADARGELRRRFPEAVADVENELLISGDYDPRLDLTSNPDLAGLPLVSYLILSAGMHAGWFTGQNLGHYITTAGANYVGARRIVKGLDCADQIAMYAIRFERVLRLALTQPPAPAAAPAPAERPTLTVVRPAEPVPAGPTEPAASPAPAPDFDLHIIEEAEPVDKSIIDLIPVNETTKRVGGNVARKSAARLGRIFAFLVALLQAGDPRAWAFVTVAVVGILLLIYFERKALAGWLRSLFRLAGRLG